MNDSKPFKNAANAKISPLKLHIGAKKPIEGPGSTIRPTSPYAKYANKAFNRPEDGGADKDGFDAAKAAQTVTDGLSPKESKFTQAQNTNTGWGKKVTEKDNTMKESVFDKIYAQIKAGKSFTINEADDLDVNAPGANLDGAGFDDNTGDMVDPDVPDENIDDIDDDDIDDISELKIILRNLKEVIDRIESKQLGAEDDLGEMDDLGDDLNDDAGGDLGGEADPVSTPMESCDYGKLKNQPKSPSGKAALSKNKVPGKLKNKRGKKANANMKNRDNTGRLSTLGKPQLGPGMSDKVAAKAPGKGPLFK